MIRLIYWIDLIVLPRRKPDGARVAPFVVYGLVNGQHVYGFCFSAGPSQSFRRAYDAGMNPARSFHAGIFAVLDDPPRAIESISLMRSCSLIL